MSLLEIGGKYSVSSLQGSQMGGCELQEKFHGHHVSIDCPMWC